MHHGDGLPAQRKSRRARAEARKTEPDLADGEGVVGARLRGLHGGLAEVVLRLCQAVKGPDPDRPADVPAFVPLLSAAIVMVSLAKHAKKEDSP